MPEIDTTVLHTRLAERRAAKAAREAAKQQENNTPPSYADYDVNDFIDNLGDRETTDDDRRLDMAIDSIDILDAYKRWCGKMTPRVYPGQTESIKVSCPNPRHPDRDPSAWVNTAKGTGYCGGCELGFDKYDLAAWHYGMGVPEYKDGKSFHDLRRKIAAELGFTVVRGKQQTFLVPPPPAEEPDPDPAPTIEEVEATAALPSAIAAELDEFDEEELKAIYTKIDWRDLLPRDTFLRTWMLMNCDDDVPEEFHFWTGLTALGFVLGQRIKLEEENEVAANLFVCFIGEPGSGKSKAKRKLDMLLNEALPYDPSLHTGVRHIEGSGSGEHLISKFVAPVMDPSNPKMVAYYAPISGFINYGELSDMMARAGRQGSTLKTTLMEFADGSKRVGTGSMTHGDHVAYDAFAQVLTTTQPGTIRTLFKQSDAGSGFLSRWVFAPGAAKPPRPVVKKTGFDVTAAANILKKIVAWAQSFSKMEWSDEGLAAYTKLYFDKIDPIKRGADNKDLIIRIDLQAKRLMMLFAADNGHKEITATEVEQYDKLFPYVMATYGNLGKQLNRTEAGDIRDKILSVIKRLHDRNKQYPSKKQIYDAIGRRSYTDQMLTRTMSILLELELIYEVAPPAGKVGRPTIRYALAE